MPRNDWTVIEWSAWEGFLIRHALPQARRLVAPPGMASGAVADFDGPVLCHINLTCPRLVFADLYEWIAQSAEAGLAPCNGYCDSIDKWAIQEACHAHGLPVARAGPTGNDEELLVVKSRANHGAKYERLFPAELFGSLAPPPWPHPERVRCMRRGEVLDRAWADPRLAVERLITNPAGLFHRAYVVGRYVAAATARAEGVIKEMCHRTADAFRSDADGSVLPRDNFDPLSVAFRLAQGMRADYAAIDLAVDDRGQAYPIDLNSTPWWGNDFNPRLVDEMAAAFAELAATGSLYSAANAAASAR